MFDNLRKKLSDTINIFAKKEKAEENKQNEISDEEQKKEEQKNEPEKQETLVNQKEEIQKQAEDNKFPNEEKSEDQNYSIIFHNVSSSTDSMKPKERDKEKSTQEENIKMKLQLSTKLKSILIKNISLNENEVDDFLENIKLVLLKSDVSFDTTDNFIEEMKANILSTKFDSRHLQKELANVIRQSLYDILKRNDSGVDIMQFVKSKISENNIPIKILFLGPNGTGKTTTIAKIAYMLKNNDITSCLSASDTFRAAAIEQSVYHADKVGIPVIKSTYGADPASVAFDAIAYAKRHNIQVVLIDSAGRQDTNKNLINEMQKIVRISKPNLTIFVGESTAGNVLADQISEFNKFIKIDGIILTKLDCDAKGGNAISIAHETGIPILFFGTGESYSALIPYNINFIVDAIAPAA